MKIRTWSSSVENVKRLFSNTPNQDTIDLKDAFIAWERPNPENVESHKAWLSNMLFHLKYHDLLLPVYSFNTGHKKITGLQLTLKGKKALGRIGESVGNDTREASYVNGQSKISLDDIMRAIPKLKQENPEFNITFSVIPKKDNADIAGIG